MATEKNITIKQFNGTDYDTLYPKTIAAQIDDVYSKSETYPKSQLYTQSQLYTKEQILTDATKTLYGLGADAVPDNAFQQIKTLINNVQSNANSRARVQTGSYVGTGTFGANNPCSLTFNFAPKVVYIIQSTDILDSSPRPYIIYSHFMQIVSGASSGSGGYIYKRNDETNYSGSNAQVLCSFNDKAVSWYNAVPGMAYANNAINQMNNSGTTYYYIAIG